MSAARPGADEPRCGSSAAIRYDVAIEPAANIETTPPREVQDRVFGFLTGGLLADQKSAASIELLRAGRARRGEFEIETSTVSRSFGSSERPLHAEPVSPSVPVGLWARAWPPTKADDARSKEIDIPEVWEIKQCIPCEAKGKVPCAACKGEGKVLVDTSSTRRMHCKKCQGSGKTACAKCAGTGRLLRTTKIVQKASPKKLRLSLPEGAKDIPKGQGGHELALEQAIGFANRESARLALQAAAPSIAEWQAILEDAVTKESRCDTNARVAWQSLRGRWYEGWELVYRHGEEELVFFVPDGPAEVVGPPIRSQKKLAIAAGVAALAVAAVIALVVLL